MPGPVTRDSIGKCAPSNDLYAMIRNPTAKMPAQASPAKKVDTLKSLRAQMEHQAIASVGKTMKNFIVVARAGKYIFLAIALPPYIFFYGIPKWLLVDGLPILIKFGSRPFQAIQEKMSKIFKTQDNKGLVGGLRNIWKAISTKATEYIKWVDHTSKALFVHLKHQVVALGYRLLQPYVPALFKGLKVAEAATKMLFGKTYQKGNQHLEVAKQFISFAWKTAKQEFANQFRPHVEAVKTTFKNLKKKVEKLIEKPRLKIEKLKKAITHTLERTNEVLKSTGLKITKEASTITLAAVSYVARPIIEWISPKIQWSASMWQAGREKLSQNFERMRGFIQNVASGAMDVARMSRHVVITSVKNIFEAVAPAFVKQFFNSDGGFKKKSQELLQKLEQKVQRLKRATRQFISDSLQQSKKLFFSFLKQAREWLFFLGRQIKQMPKRILSATTRSYRLMIQLFLKLGHLLRWIAILSRVLGRLAWQELREKTSFIRD